MEHNGSVVVHGDPLTITKIYPFRVGLINDLHVGSWYGICPPEYKDMDDEVFKIPLNKGQKILLKYWEEFIGECIENKVNYLWIPGDLLSGQNPIEKGKYVMDVDLDHQMDMATELIAGFVKKVTSIKEVWLWKGTGYHGSKETSIEEGVAYRLEKRGIKTRYFSEYQYIELLYNGKKKHIFVKHPTTDSALYPEMAMGKEMRLMQEKVAQGKLPPVDIQIHAHKHEFVEVHKASIRSLQLPCWQFFVPYDSAMKNYSAFQPDIGGVIMLFDEKLRSVSWHFTYPNFIDPKKFIKVEINPTGVNKARLSKK